ncbi:MAG TPA: hypothetical protein VGR50_07815 [Terriglobales bacterium]|nr:hypothetical protein [Terriglobales bacterium]
MKRLLTLTLLCIAGFATANTARAEGCDSTPVPLSEQEKAFYSTFSTLRSTIPQPPTSWQVNERSQDKLAQDYEYMPENRCPGSNYYIGLGIAYERPISQAEMDAEVAAMQTKPDPAKQKKLDELAQQRMALVQKAMEAAQKQDYKTVDSLGKQGDALDKQMTALQQDMNSGRQATIDAIQRDRKAQVDISINSAAGGVSCYGSPKALQVPGAVAYECAAPATFSSPGNPLDPPKGRIVVVYGPAEVKQSDWSRKDAEGKQVKDSYVSIKTSADAGRYPEPTVVVVDVSGDDLARAESLYKQMDLKPLAALVKH